MISELLEEYIYPVFAISVVVSLAFYALVIVISTIEISTNRSQCVVTVDGQVWYSGRAYKVDCNSAGPATICKENSGNPFTAMATKRVIMSKNITEVCK